MEKSIPTFGVSFFVKKERKARQSTLVLPLTVNPESTGFSLKHHVEQKLWAETLAKHSNTRSRYNRCDCILTGYC